MSTISKAKFISSLAGMFAVGALAGSLATSALAPLRTANPNDSRRSERTGPPPDHKEWSFEKFMMGKLCKDVGLTQSQSNAINPMVIQLGKDVELVRVNGIKETEQIFQKFHTSVLALVNEDQKPLLEKMEKGRQDWVSKNGGKRSGPGGKRGGPGPGDGQPNKGGVKPPKNQ